MKDYKIPHLVLLLTPFVFSFALGLDIYIPIVPQMADIFETTPSMVQLTLSLFLLTSGVGQLFIGPLSDQFGRKSILLVSSAAYTAGSVFCAFSSDILWLIISRLICSMGAAGMIATSFALVRDLFTSDKSARVYSFLNGAVGISPTFAPIIGGYLAFYFGWKSVFFFLTFIGLVALYITWYFIEETNAVENRVKIDRNLLSRYKEIFSNRQFLIFSSISGLAEGVFFCFFSISPFIIIDLLGIPSHEFGYYFLFFGLVIALGGLMSGKIIEKIGVANTLALGIALMFLGGFSMLAWDYWTALTLTGFLVPMIIACTGAMFIVGGCAAGALEPFGSIAGTASAGFGAVQFSISSLAGCILMLFPITSTVYYGISIVLMAGGSLALFTLRNKTTFARLNP